MTAFNIDRLTTSAAPGLAVGARGEITTTFPWATLGATATTVLVESPGTSWPAAGQAALCRRRRGVWPAAQVDKGVWYV